jgi:flavin reductase (DIM6/NTAB) family NADH-FMN oxidoreductase RutF
MRQSVSLTHFTPLLHPCLTFLVTSVDPAGNPNIITIAWLTPLSVEPPLVGMSLRPSRHSFELIRSCGEFVVNVAPYEIARQALFCGRRSGRDVNKLEATGLTARSATCVKPPILEECLAHVECKVVREVDCGDHVLVIGEVLAASAQTDVVDADGRYDLARAKPLIHLGGDFFTTTQAQAVNPGL